MKINRNYRFVLTCVSTEDYEKAASTAQENARIGKMIFESECHYYAEKEILSAIKEADKSNRLDDYRGNVYLVWKETKPETRKTTEEVDGKKITTEEILPTTATLIETIRIVGDSVEIR